MPLPMYFLYLCEKQVNEGSPPYFSGSCSRFFLLGYCAATVNPDQKFTNFKIIQGDSSSWNEYSIWGSSLGSFLLSSRM